MAAKTYPLAWHEENLASANVYLSEKRQALARMQAEVEEVKNIVAFYERQIAEAKQRGLTEFDPCRFLVKRKRP